MIKLLVVCKSQPGLAKFETKGKLQGCLARSGGRLLPEAKRVHRGFQFTDYKEQMLFFHLNFSL